MRFGGGSKPPHHLPRPGAAARLAKDPAAEKAMWSAVALQQHITRGLMHEGRLGDAPRPTAQRDGQLSLAQKMGLAPRPPPAPEEGDWRQAEAMSRYRDDALGSCSICCELLVARGGNVANAALVITNCSHVFHERCLTQVDRFARRAGQRKQCPMCRREGYYTRPYRAAAAIVQRHAVTRLQAWARGLAARRAYLAARLRRNPQFHTDYYYGKLRRYADAMLLRAVQREKTVDDVIAEATQRSALARLMLLDEGDWDAIRATAFRRHAEEGDDGAPVVVAPPHLRGLEDHQPRRGFECPVCLGAVAPMRRPATAPAPAGPGFRLERVADLAPKASTTKSGAPARGGVSDRTGNRTTSTKSAPKGLRGASAVPAKAKPASDPRRAPKSAEQHQGALAPMRVVFDPKPEPPPQVVPTGRDGVITSCAHCFHAQCLHAFEQHTGVAPRAEARPGDAPPTDAEVAKCPCCRAVYASAPLYEPLTAAV